MKSIGGSIVVCRGSIGVCLGECWGLSGVHWGFIHQESVRSLLVTKFGELVWKALQIWRADSDSSPN
jgi:hypothetical protein